MPVDVAPLITGDTYDPVVEVAGDTETLTEARLINTARALGDRIEYIRRRTDAAMAHPESIVNARDDFLWVGDVDANTICSELTWVHGTPTGAVGGVTFGSLAGTPKNPGQLTIITDNVADSGKYFTLGPSFGGSVNFGGTDGFEHMTIVLKAIGNTNVAQKIAFGLVDDRLLFDSTDSFQVFIDQALTGPDWGLRVKKAGAGAASIAAMGAFVSQEFLVVDFIRNAALGLDVYSNGALITTVAAANLPNGTGVWGGYVKNGAADTDPLTAGFDLFHYRGPIATRSGL